MSPFYLSFKSPSFLDKKFSDARKRKTGRMNPTPTFEIAALSSKAITGGWIPASAGMTQRGTEIVASFRNDRGGKEITVSLHSSQ